MLYNLIYIARIYTIPEQFITSGFVCNSAVANLKRGPSPLHESEFSHSRASGNDTFHTLVIWQ